MIEIVAKKDYERLDVFLSEELDISRTRVKHLIDDKNIRTKKKSAVLKASTKVLAGQKFFAEIPSSLNIEYLKAEPIDFGVVYEDEYLLVVDKPSGIVVHPAPGNWRGTLVNGLVYRYPEMREMTTWLRPGIVQRLDAGTSGLMVVAKKQKVSQTLQTMFQERKIDKKYIALIHGCPKRKEGTISGPVDRDPNNFLKMCVIEGGKPSKTGYKVLWSKNKVSMIVCKLFTGRMHQIRVHMSALGYPLLGDFMYGAKDEFARVYLHSWQLEFTHPVTEEKMLFTQKVTPDFVKVIAGIKDGGKFPKELLRQEESNS